MVSNPMKKRATISFLTGMIITLIVCVLIGGVVFFVVSQKNKQKEKEEGVLTYAYRLNTNVKSGEEISQNKVEPILIPEKAVPLDAFPSKKKNGEIWQPVNLPTDEKTIYRSKVNLSAGTILASNLVYQGEKIADDVRYVEYNMLVLPTTIEVGDYVDIRLTLPNGQDLIVISKKEIKTLLGDTIGLDLSEGEIVMMDSAIVEAYIMNASKLYVIQYIEPDIQTAAIKTYVPTSAVQNLISLNGNIKNEAKAALQAKFDVTIRQHIDADRIVYEGTQQENLEEQIQKQINNAKAAREAYLSNLTSY